MLITLPLKFKQTSLLLAVCSLQDPGHTAIVKKVAIKTVLFLTKNSLNCHQNPSHCKESTGYLAQSV